MGASETKDLTTDGLRDHLVVDLLGRVEHNGRRSQRQLATDMGVAVGLVNVYVRRCIKKGLIKVSEAPARRYVYYLTPRGFAEKSRLTAEYLSRSLSFFRMARRQCGELLDAIAGRGHRSVALVGVSDLTEIAILSALEHGIEVRAVVDAGAPQARIAGVPVVARPEDIDGSVDAWIITAISGAQDAFDDTRARFPDDRVFTPALLGVVCGPPMEIPA